MQCVYYSYGIVRMVKQQVYSRNLGTKNAIHYNCDVFPGQLLKRVPPNRKLGDEHSIPLEPGAKLV